MSSVIFDKFQNGVRIARPDFRRFSKCLSVQSDISGSCFSSFNAIQFDENVAVFTSVQGLGAEAEVLGGGGQPPTSGEQFIRLLNTVSFEITEKGFQKLLQVFAQRNLKNNDYNIDIIIE